MHEIKHPYRSDTPTSLQKSLHQFFIPTHKIIIGSHDNPPPPNKK